MAKKVRKRATSIYNFENKKFDLIEFEGEWKAAFGQPQKGGLWYIGGLPTNGKTSFLVKLIKEFAVLGMRVRFYNFEEQESVAMQKIIRREKLSEVARRVQIVNYMMSYKEIKEELETLRLEAVAIDTVQKAGLTAKQIEDLREQFPHITIVVSCHVMPNGLPDKQAAKQAYREAHQKIKVDRYRAISEGRSFGELGYYPIWKEKADVLWADNL